MHAVPEHLRGVITTRHYTNPRLSYLTLPDQNWCDMGHNAYYGVE